TRAALVLWGGWLVVTAAVFRLSKGIIHPYYTVALAPAIAALVGIGAATLWHHRSVAASWLLAVAVGTTAVWSYVLLNRSPSWHPQLRGFVLFGGLALAVVIAAWSHVLVGWARGLVAGAAIVVALMSPL